MKLTKCENRHFYDADKFDVCPHCEKHSEKVVTSTQDKIGQSISEQPQTATTPVSVNRDTFSPHTGSIWDQNLDPKTASFFDEFKVNNESAPIAPPPSLPEVPPQQEQEKSVEIPNDTTTDVVFEPVVESVMMQPIPQEATPLPQNSLAAQVNAVVSHGASEDVKTVAFYNFTDTEPVVGWLVCIAGEYLGESFNLKAGQNFIGRALTMDVPLAKDTSVSREKHAIVIYDPQNRVFFVQPGDSSGLTYFNGQLLLAFQPLGAYDKIKLGNSEFVFVPCCGEQFTWEDYL